MIYFIYKTTNLINNKFYIGQHRQETSGFDGYLGSGNLLIHAIKKYGRKNFIRETIEYCTIDDIDYREIYWIDYFKAIDKNIGYNINRGGQTNIKIISKETIQKIKDKRKYQVPPMLGKHHSQETKDKIGIANKEKLHIGIPCTDETKEKISKANMGRKKTPETIQKIKDKRKDQIPPMLGRQHSDKTKEKMRQVQTGKHFENSNNKYDYILSNKQYYRTFFTPAEKRYIIKKFSCKNNPDSIVYKGIQIERKLKDAQSGNQSNSLESLLGGN